MQIQSAETTHHVVAVGVFFGLISLNLVGDISKKIRDYPHLEIFFTSEIIFNFSGETLGYMFKKPCGKFSVHQLYFYPKK